jgi:hypothetical protein
MKPNVNSDVLYFAGPPQRLILTSPVPRFARSEGALAFTPGDELTKAMPGECGPVRARTRRFQGAVSLRVRIDRRTLPGIYSATISSGGDSFRSEIRVEPRLRLRASPAGLLFHARPGEDASVDLTLENTGNVEADIPETISFGIYDNQGIETALASTYNQDTHDIQQLVGHFVDKLRDGYGGLLKVRVVSGGGKLRPGEGRRIRMTSRLPAKLKQGHAYHGVWMIETLHASVSVIVCKTELREGLK